MLEKDFLGYLKALKKSMDERSGFDVGEKALMCLSSETVEGLHITGIDEKLLYWLLFSFFLLFSS